MASAMVIFDNATKEDLMNNHLLDPTPAEEGANIYQLTAYLLINAAVKQISSSVIESHFYLVTIQISSKRMIYFINVNNVPNICA